MRPIRCVCTFTMTGALLIQAAGCEAPAMTNRQTMAPPQAQPQAMRAQDPSPQAEFEGVAPEVQALAAQSQRDVNAILAARSQTQAPPINSMPQPQPIAEPRRVIWNDSSPQALPRAWSAPAQQPLFNVAPDDPIVMPEKPSASIEQAAPPAAALETDRLKRLMVDLTRELYANGAYSESPLRELIVIAAMSLVDPERKLQPHAIPDLTDKERQLLAALQNFFAELGVTLSNASDAEAAIVESVTKLRTELVQPPSISLPNAMLCMRVSGFGDYTPFDKYTFLAHIEQKAILYLEIRGFASDINPKGEYVTELSQQLVIYSDRDGIPVWKEDWQAAVDVSKNKRQDFFTVQVIALPKALSVGRYQLKVRVRDEKSKAEAETSIPFEMVADPKMTAKGS